MSHLIRLAALTALLMGAAAPASAQDGLLRNVLGQIGILPAEKDPIEYKERPALVVPKDVNTLRQPVAPESHAANPAWPVDPDVADRKREQARRKANGFTGSHDADNGGRMSLDQMAAGRANAGARMGETTSLGNDRGGVKLSVEEMSSLGRTATAPTYAPGTEPPRRTLTDPPRGLRMPAANAPYQAGRAESRIFDDRRPEKME